MNLSFSSSLPPPAILLDRVSLVYKDRPVFINLNARFPAGKINVLLGSSGAGKSSLLKMIAGLEPEYRGRIKTDDHYPLIPRISYMAQQDCLLPWKTILKNIMIGHQLRGEKQDRNSALHILEQVGLLHCQTMYPEQLSGGMRQRVALARTLYENRPVILMDEPFSALDSLTRIKMQDFTATLLRGKTVILITHDPFEACRIGEHIQIMTGQPAQLHSIQPVSGSIPHDLNSTAFQHAHARLLNQLMDPLIQ